MKKIFFLVLILVNGYYGQCQTKRQVEQLATLGKVWGFLKYYHPSALRGKPDWDKELVRLIPLAERAITGKAFDSLMENWYDLLPAAKLATEPINWRPDSVVRIFTEKNIQRFAVSNRLRNKLQLLYHYHVPDTSRYVTRYYGNHLYDHIIHTEDAHERPAYPSREVRLLALFRYWNTIEYFYPHKQRIGNWDKVLTRYISRFLQAEDSNQYRYAIRELIHELPDSHSFIQEPGGTYYFYPFRLDYIQGKYIIGHCDGLIAKTNDYQLGDEIIAVNGKTTSAREKELLKIITGTNRLSLYRNIAQELLKNGDSVVQVSFNRKGRRFTKEVVLHSWPVHSKLQRMVQPLWRQLEKGIWYVRFCGISNPDTLKSLFRDISLAKTVIWDMRDYPNYKVTTELYQYLFPSKIIFTEERNASDFFPGSFIKSPYYFMPVEGKFITVYTGSLIVLVDEHTQSLSESVAAVLKLRSNTITMGRQTAGTTGNITWLTLPGGIEVSYTGAGVTGMQQSFSQGDGVRIDIPIELTTKKIAESPDYILAKAIEYARKL
jgi:carboxyl-terminal processing protease